MAKDSDPCTPVRPDCAHAFKEIAVTLGKLAEQVGQVREHTATLFREVVGNGSGRPGLREEVGAMKAALAERHEASSRSWGRVTQLIVLLLSGASLLTAVLVAVLK